MWRNLKWWIHQFSLWSFYHQWQHEPSFCVILFRYEGSDSPGRQSNLSCVCCAPSIQWHIRWADDVAWSDPRDQHQSDLGWPDCSDCCQCHYSSDHGTCRVSFGIQLQLPFHSFIQETYIAPLQETNTQRHLLFLFLKLVGHVEHLGQMPVFFHIYYVNSWKTITVPFWLLIL